MNSLHLAQNAVNTIQEFLEQSSGEGRSDVLARLAEHQLDEVEYQPQIAALKPVTRLLPQAFDDIRHHHSGMARALVPVLPGLRWMQSASYNDDVLGPGFLENYAWAELVGAHGFFIGHDFRLGLLLLGPRQHYIDHYHPAPELYVPLTAGSFWKKGGSGFIERKAGELIWHPPMIVHATKTFDAPLLAIYVWTKDTGTPATLVA